MARIFLTIVCTVLLAHGIVGAQGPQITLQQPMTVPGPDVLATSVVNEIPPGGLGSAPHFHSGPAVGYVIEGEYLFQVHGKPLRIIPAGEAFYELDRDIHVWSANASNSTICKLTVTIFGRPNEDFITFVEDYKRESREEAIAKARQTPGLSAPETKDELKK